MEFFIEMTDTFGGEANYCWVKRFLVTANTARGAMGKLSKRLGGNTRFAMDCGEAKRYDSLSGCICFFVQESDGDEKTNFNCIESL